MKNILLIVFLFVIPTVACADGEMLDGKQKIISNFEECVEAGNVVMRSYPPKCGTKDGVIFTREVKKKEVCKNTCGNGTCEEIVCMALGCPCSESPESCPQDCS